MSDSRKDPDAAVVLAEEHLIVGKREVETGRVTVRVVTDSETTTVRESLFDHGVDIKHVPIGREVKDVPAIRQEGETTIIPVLEEVFVVEKRLVLIEEIHVRRTVGQTEVEQPVILRRQRAEIVRSGIPDPSTKE